MPSERPLVRSTRTSTRPTYGDIGFASLLIAVVSGVVLALPYDVGTPYDSVARLMLTNPGGVFFRNLHYWSAQAFLILTLIHIWDHLRQGAERRVRFGIWIRLSLSIPLAAFLMLSGFMLKGDAEGLQAWRIVSTATEQIPLVGPWLSVSLFGSGSDLQILYVHHIATATIFVWLLVVEHARSVWPRTAALAATFAPILILSLLVAPGLHDGLNPIVKGPWYFLGLQETLHWISHPLVIVLLGAGLLAAVVALARMPRPMSRPVKISLLLVAILYGALTVVGYLFRGEGWALVWPSQARGVPGLTFSPLVGFRGTADEEVGSRDIPTVLGRREGCLFCHGEMKGFTLSHSPDAVGCASCHGGDPFSLDKAVAHRGMVLMAGNLQVARRTCGTPQCHPAIVDRVGHSIMTTFSGVISVDRAVWGEPTDERPAHVDQLGSTPADSHLRQLCASCHLGAPKAELGPVHEDSRGGGCSACHLNYSGEALEALRRYQQDRAAGKTDLDLAEHPRLSIEIGSEHCFGCHSRSGRISTSYEGWHETELAAPPTSGGGRYRVLEDGRVFVQVGPDGHFTKGLECVDCHTSREAMGDGVVHTRKYDQMESSCEDCHFRGPAATVSGSRLDAEAQKILTVRQQPMAGRDYLTARTTGLALVNAFVDAERKPWMQKKKTGEVLALKPPAPACIEGSAHQRLSCISCHTSWAPRCPSCHTRFDANRQAYDHLDDAEVVGAWVEEGRDFRADPPTLGIRTITGHNGERRDMVDTFVPGMVLTIDRNQSPDHPPDVMFRRLYARLFSHTITLQGRSCESCHNDPVALGYGRGTLTYQRLGTQGRWVFTAEHERSGYDGLPSDAWIGFLQTRTSGVSTREDVRPFDVGEQQRILAVGACLTCHDSKSAVMKEALLDFKGTVARVRESCVLPRWP